MVLLHVEPVHPVGVVGKVTLGAPHDGSALERHIEAHLLSATVPKPVTQAQEIAGLKTSDLKVSGPDQRVGAPAPRPIEYKTMTYQ